MAIQMNALKIGDQIGLVFTTVLDQVSLGLVEEDEEIQEVADRAYWENRANKKTVSLSDELLQVAKIFDSELELKYNQFYIGLSKNSQPRNFITMSPKKGFIRLALRMQHLPETTERLESAGLDVMDYSARTGRYRIRLKPSEIEKQKEILSEVIGEAFCAAGNE